MKISLATTADIKPIISLIQDRIDWMDEMDIHQWNKSDYLTTFSLEYFNEVIENKNLYKVEDNNKTIIGAFTLFDQDARWTDDTSALYIHNFVSKIGVKNVGNYIISFCEEKARDKKVLLLRIDCQQNNPKLNNYYEKHGFLYINSFEEELYSGNRREKHIKQITE